MPIPCPGPGQISLLDLQSSFENPNSVVYPISLNQFYRGGSYVANNSANQNIPTSGQIALNNFFCSAGYYSVVISANTTNFDVYNAFVSKFGASVWTSGAPKFLVINSGVIVGSSLVGSTSVIANYALYVNAPSSPGGGLIIDNYGSIQGAGGFSNGGNGGNAIYTNVPIFINNQGSIYGGGGAGGAGTQSSTSQPSNLQYVTHPTSGTTVSLTTTLKLLAYGGRGQGYNQSNTSPFTAVNRYGFDFYNNAAYKNANLQFPPHSDVTTYNLNSYTQYLNIGSDSKVTLQQYSSGIGNVPSLGSGYMSVAGSNNTLNFSNNTSGIQQLIKDPNQTYSSSMNIITITNQAGGGTETAASIVSILGNWGAFFNQPLPAIGSNQGSGGDGGQGGNFGASGASGAGGSGGSAGYYLYGLSNTTWINQGTVAGQVGG